MACQARAAAGQLKEAASDAGVDDELEELLPSECSALGAVVRPLSNLLGDYAEARRARVDTHKVLCRKEGERALNVEPDDSTTSSRFGRLV